MSSIFEFFGGATKVFGWLIYGVIIPATTWFVIIRTDIAALKEASDKQDQEIVIIKKDNAATKDAWNNSLVEIQRSLGRIEGKISK
jgi:hypothetical protein